TSKQIATQIRAVEEHILEYMQSCLAKFGLIRWCPDLQQTAYSLYNSACRIIALDTFKQALVSHTYTHLQPNTTYAKDMDLLIKLYDHFVHHYQYQCFKKESHNPGSIQAAEEMNPKYQNHKQVSRIHVHMIYF
ncbi:MAG TPA: hypothetical protein VGO47_00010, partial [Chlamydiales bacterium]|nr:hypothetical protein [Chlamydiales bacterium]